MSVIVFFGINIVGDPVWLLVNPQMDQKDIEAAVRALGPRPADLGAIPATFSSGALHGDLGRSFIFGEPALRVIIERMPATLGAGAGGIGDGRGVGIPLGLYAGLKPDSLASQDHHGRLDPGLQPADVLGRTDADHGVRRDARLAAIHRARRRLPPISASPRACSRSTACATSCCRLSTWRCSRCRW